MEGITTWTKDGLLWLQYPLGVTLSREDRIKLVVAGFGWYGKTRAWAAEEKNEAAWKLATEWTGRTNHETQN